MLHSLLSLGVLVSALGGAAAQGQTCQKTANAATCEVLCANGATFDLSPLHKPSVPYEVKDFDAVEGLDDASLANYSYIFNICGEVATVPGAGPNGASDSCTTTQGDATPTSGAPVQQSGVATAFQVANWKFPGNDMCHRMGSTATPATMQWSEFEAGDPSRGLSLKYSGGDYCAGIANTPRSLTIHILCANDLANVPDVEPVEEVQPCQYALWFTSIYGCPMQCGVDKRQLCGGKGACRFDRDLQAPRCFCSSGWGGEACAEKVASLAAGVAVSVAFIMLCLFTCVLICVLVGVVLMWLKVRTLRLDPRAYASLDEDMVQTRPVPIDTHMMDDDEKEAQL